MGMTIEEARKIIKQFRDRQGNSSDDIDAFDMAIKVLEERLKIHDTCKKCVEFSNFEQQPCDDCISREAVEEITWEEPSYTDALNAITEIRDKIRQLPSVTPKQKVGKWIDNSKEDGYYANCSHCGYQIDIHYERGYLNYCPNCGAKMEEVEQEVEE